MSSPTPQSTLDFNASPGPALQSFCPYWTPIALRGLMRQWLLLHFADPGNIVAPELQNRPWTAADDTGIQIEDVARWHPQITEKRPAVMLKRGEVNIVQSGLHNDMLLGGGGTAAAREVHSTLFTGSHIAYCIGRESGICEILAGEVWSELMKFGPVVRGKLNLVRFRVMSVGALAKLEEASQDWVVPVVCSYAAWSTWEITALDAARLSNVQLVVENLQ